MKNFKYLLIIVAVCCYFSCIVMDLSFAGNTDTYKITVQSIQLKNTDGQWVTIATPNQELDIAAVSSGAVAASFLNKASIPAGSYDNFKLVISETMKVSGSDVDGGTTYYTRSGGAVTITGDDSNAASTSTWVGALPNATLAETTDTATTVLRQKGEVTYTLDLKASDGNDYIEIYSTTDLATPITVNVNSTISMWFDFDTAGTVHYQLIGAGDHAVFYTPPGEGTAFSITVDGTTSTITADQMRLDF